MSVTTSCFKEIVFLVCVYRLTLNELGWKKLSKTQIRKEEYCEVNNGENALDIVNEFLSEYLPKYLNEL